MRNSGIILIVESVLLFVIYPVMWSYLPLHVRLLTLLVLAVPPMIAGILFIISHTSTLGDSLSLSAARAVSLVPVKPIPDLRKTRTNSGV